ncbi:hypothetical protein [Zunongwangia sp. HGR-M22]|uniref:hypothetical protein n=1 Tax=Zunongwangia sp. HGR-M22 TaxID=3015168 RepID=UPI0022DDEB97|nr:hypothetical protein [Zunongwangia sp. HGR-M22]WBL24313.1 hypothetical protein PBT91_10335 [Zunongwangia sp. HGR-M22]
MYQTLLQFHSIFRWLVLLSLGYAIFIAITGYYLKRNFTKKDNTVRHWTATIAHIQLILGILGYTQSPMTTHFFKYYRFSEGWNEAIFFGMFHILLMFTAIVLITIGSASAKRKEPSSQKFKTMLIFFALALIIILIAIPWPFSPLGNRPLLRTF